MTETFYRLLDRGFSTLVPSSIRSMLQKIQLKHGIFIKQPLRKATEFVLKLLVQLSAILFAFASAQAYPSCQICTVI